MKPKTARQSISGGMLWDVKTGQLERDPNAPDFNKAKSLLKKKKRQERQRKKLARRKLKGLH